MEHGYEVAPQELKAQIAALAELGDKTDSLAGSAGRLAERTPLLGTAPPALHLAMRLRQEAGRTGLTGEVDAAGKELGNCHRALRDSVAGYVRTEAEVLHALGKAVHP